LFAQGHGGSQSDPRWAHEREEVGEHKLVAKGSLKGKGEKKGLQWARNCPLAQG